MLLLLPLLTSGTLPVSDACSAATVEASETFEAKGRPVARFLLQRRPRMSPSVRPRAGATSSRSVRSAV